MIANEVAKDNDNEIHQYDCPPSDIKEFFELRRKYNDTNIEKVEDNDPLIFLVEHMFGLAHGMRNWKSAKFYQAISEILTVSDEAFVLLSIENAWEAIKDEMEDEKEEGAGRTKNKHCRGKYTNHGMNMKYAGWSSKGIERYVSHRGLARPI
jgi:hypothetical protein